jgi:hypothetical protein
MSDLRVDVLHYKMRSEYLESTVAALTAENERLHELLGEFTNPLNASSLYWDPCPFCCRYPHHTPDCLVTRALAELAKRKTP